MLKIQMALIALLIGCLTFTSCDRIPPLVTPEMPAEEMMPEEMMPEEMMPEEMMPEEMMPEEMMPEEMMPEEMMAAYTSWLSGTLPTPVGTGAIHGQGARTVYINDVGAMALQDGMATFPAGTMVVKDIMNDDNTAIAKTESMTKSDDPMYADTDGWLYNGMGSQAGCHDCHALAGTDGKPGMDAVFTTQLLMASMAGMGDMDDDMDDMADMDDMDNGAQ